MNLLISSMSPKSYPTVGYEIRIGMTQMALRDSLAKEGFKYDVKLESA